MMKHWSYENRKHDVQELLVHMNVSACAPTAISVSSDHISSLHNDDN